MSLRCLIADDEPGSHLVLKRYLEELPFTEYTGSCYNAIQVYHFLKNNKADILLLDINMPEIDGFALLDMLEEPPAVIITTAYSDYAIKSYEYDAVDYLHKPIRFERFVKAIEKASRRLNQQDLHLPVSSLEIRVDGRPVTLAPEDILFVQSMGNYVKIVCRQKTYITALTTKELEHRLPTPQFIRIHKSFIVNTAYIREVNPAQVVLEKEVLPVGKTFKKYLERFLNK
ncbi:MAG TPA: LytTR family DNA-binding domain-containing protein [Chitinophagaceae bacterium]|nr:LytTR family DNA-binding domain-containing protein [Chitinophagaceae bacterium]